MKSKTLATLAGSVFVAVVIGAYLAVSGSRNAYWLIPVGTAISVTFLFLSGLKSEWFYRVFEKCAKRFPVLVTFFFLAGGFVITAYLFTVSVLLGLRVSKQYFGPDSDRQTVSAPKNLPPTEPPRDVTSSKKAVPMLPVPPVQGRDEFYTYAVMRPDNSMTCLTTTNMVRLLSCVDVRDSVKKDSSADRLRVLGTTLQHYMIPLVFRMGRGESRGGKTIEGRVKEAPTAPIDPPEMVGYTSNQIIAMPPDIYPLWFYTTASEPSFKLPKETKITFLENPATTNFGYGYIARLERKGFYRIDISVCKWGATLDRQVPEGYTIPDSLNINDLKTHRFLVRTEWTIERSHGASFVVSDYERWAKELASNLRDRLED